MIRHIFTILWNERKTNGWILLEYVFVFCILWFCCDYLFYIGRCYLEPTGFDIHNTYSLEFIKIDEEKTDEYNTGQTVIERVRNHPAVLYACFSQNATPYNNSKNIPKGMIHPDSIIIQTQEREISPEYIDVFGLQIEKGRRFMNPDNNWKEVMISPDRYGAIGEKEGKPIPAETIHSFSFPQYLDNSGKTVAGITTKIKNSFFEPYMYNIFTPIDKENFSLERYDLSIRIKPEAIKGFEERFMEEMRTQLSIPPYIFSEIRSTNDQKKILTQRSGINNRLYSVYAILFFIFINIFLGVIGTFWYRSESRRNEIGLRIALGATRPNIQHLMYGETFFLLFIASIISVNICIHIEHLDILTTLGLPVAEHTQANSGFEHYILNYASTILLLSLVSFAGVWYPVHKATTIDPAEALKEE